MWDLALSPNGDLVISGHRDLSGKSGTDLLEQRMLLRLQIHRGSWVYDDGKTLGSNLYRLIGMSATDAHSAVEPYVNEALRGMTEIKVVSVQHKHIVQGVLTDEHPAAARGIAIIISYQVRDLDSDAVSDTRQLEISLPLSGGGA